MTDTWRKLYTKILNWQWYKSPNTCHLFIHCILKARKESAKWQGIVIPENSFITSLAHLSNETGLTIREVRTALKNLSESDENGDKEVTIKTTNRYTIVTVENLPLYQARNSDENLKNDKLAVMLTTTSKEVKKKKKDINKKENKNIFGEFQNVKLTNVEYAKLIDIYKNQKRLDKAIEILSTYIASKGDKYKNHYAVLGKHNWVYKKVLVEYPLETKKEEYNAFI